MKVAREEAADYKAVFGSPIPLKVVYLFSQHIEFHSIFGPAYDFAMSLHIEYFLLLFTGDLSKDMSM